MDTPIILQGNALSVLKTVPDNSIDMCMTSPPYWTLRDYETAPLTWDGDAQCQHEWKDANKRIPHASCVKCGAWKGQLGWEPTPESYIKHLCDIFDEVKRVLKAEGSCWVNLDDSYLKAKCLAQIPSRFAIEMHKRGWIPRQEIVWHKTKVMPESCKDRFTRDFEKLFFFTKQPNHYFKMQYVPLAPASIKRQKYGLKSNRYQFRASGGIDLEQMKGRFYNEERGRNVRAVWSIAPTAYRIEHPATYPEALCETPIAAGCPVGGIVLDPFMGAGTTAVVALKQGKDFVGIELSPEYIQTAAKRLQPHLSASFAE